MAKQRRECDWIHVEIKVIDVVMSNYYPKWLIVVLAILPHPDSGDVTTSVNLHMTESSLALRAASLVTDRDGLRDPRVAALVKWLKFGTSIMVSGLLPRCPGLNGLAEECAALRRQDGCNSAPDLCSARFSPLC